MEYSAVKSWNDLYTDTNEMAYPAEGVIRIFKGQFPTLEMPQPMEGQSIIDVGCGDGRHIALFSALGLKCYGVEISDSIVNKVSSDLITLGIEAGISVGSNDNLPFPDNFSDYLLSWNSSYYMSHGKRDFSAHVQEFARVIKRGGWIVCSIPKETCFIYDKSEDAESPGYKIIRNDFFQKRNGEIMRSFSSTQEIKKEFEDYFKNFCFSDVHMDWFGLNYHWFVFVAQRI